MVRPSPSRLGLAALALLVLVAAPLAAQTEDELIEKFAEVTQIFEDTARMFEGIENVDQLRENHEALAANAEKIEMAKKAFEGAPPPSDAARAKLGPMMERLQAAGMKISEAMNALRDQEGAAELLEPLAPLDPMAGARQSQCKNNLKQIGLGAILYSDANRSRFPAELLQGIWSSGHLEDPEVYVCPRHGIEPSEEGAEKIVSSYATWKDTSTLTSPIVARWGSQIPLAWDSSPDFHGGKRNVLYADGHVETLGEEEFQRVCAEWENHETIELER